MALRWTPSAPFKLVLAGMHEHSCQHCDKAKVLSTHGIVQKAGFLSISQHPARSSPPVLPWAPRGARCKLIVTAPDLVCMAWPLKLGPCILG